MRTFAMWALLTVAVDMIVIGIRFAVVTLFGENRLVQKYFIEPSIWAFDQLASAVIGDASSSNSTEAKKKQTFFKIFIPVAYAVYLLVPLASIPIGLVIDPICCYFIAKKHMA